MAEPEVFILAERALQRVIGRFKDDKRELIMLVDVSIRQLINNHTSDAIWVFT